MRVGRGGAALLVKAEAAPASTEPMAADHRLGFRSVREELSGVELPVEGDIPEWLSGTLLRNGPGTWTAGRQPLAHWFDGLAMCRRFEIRDGRVEYTNRFLESEAYQYVREHRQLGFREFATDPQTGPLGRLGRLAGTEFTDNASVDVCRIGDRYLATTESPRVVEIDPETLETQGTLVFGGFSDTITVHPHYDFDRRELLGYGTRLSGELGYVCYRIPEGTEDVSIIATVESDPPGYIHGFGLTPNYLVLCEPPFVPDRRALLFGSAIIDGFEWRPERGTRFHLLDRATGDVIAKKRVPPFFVFHHANAFERDGEVVVDLIAYEDATVVDTLRLRRLVSPAVSLPPGELRRYTLALDGASTNIDADADTNTHLPTSTSADAAPAGEMLYRGHIEFPAIHYERYNTREYRYVYGVGNREYPPQDFLNQLVKVDIRERRAATWHEKGTYPGEPVFVPPPDPDGEDDGVLLSVVLNAREERSFLAVLDAASFAERARAIVPHPIPFGFHGQFYADGHERPTRSMA